jgi:hypothetical protein
MASPLGYVYSRADALKRRLYDMITNPADYASMLGGRIQEGAANRESMMNQAFGDPNNPLKVTNPQALAQLTDMIMSGEMGFAPAGITAFHGSPYLFKQFDPMKKGSGEGAQAFGVGAGYTASARPVAEGYAQAISRSKLGSEGEPTFGEFRQMVGKQPIEDYYAMLDRQAAKLRGPAADDAYAKLDIVERLGLGSNAPDIKQYVQDAGYSKSVQNWVEKELIPQYKPAGYLYKGDIPDEILPKFLDWDKPLQNQPQEFTSSLNIRVEKNPDPLPGEKWVVQTDLGSVNAFNTKKQADAYIQSVTGGEIYQNLSLSIGPGNLSAKLDELGIRGIRYLDQGSRGTGAGTSNFVPFRPEDFKIQEINDIPIEDYITKGLLAP